MAGCLADYWAEDSAEKTASMWVGDLAENLDVPLVARWDGHWVGLSAAGLA